MRNYREAAYVDRLNYLEKDHLLSEVAYINAQDIYHIGYELKKNTNNDQYEDKNPGKNAIENSVSQVMKGTNGLITELSLKCAYTEKYTIEFIPVIFTTADLYVSNVNISESDLNGKLDKDKITLEKSDWLWYEYHLSPSFKHSIKKSDHLEDHLLDENFLAKTFSHKYLRTVAVVNTLGVDDFLKNISK
jgi:hypothetical protein